MPEVLQAVNTLNNSKYHPHYHHHHHHNHHNQHQHSHQNTANTLTPTTAATMAINNVRMSSISPTLSMNGNSNEASNGKTNIKRFAPIESNNKNSSLFFRFS